MRIGGQRRRKESTNFGAVNVITDYFREGFRKTVLAVAVLTVVLVSPLAFAEEQSPQRELSNLSVVGVERMAVPTQRDSFSMIQYMPDPIEGFNRGSLKVTKPAIDWVVKPLAKGWRFITPKFVRTGIDNFAYNIAYPVRLVSLLLQGELSKAGNETGHFLVNTTVGLAGLFDPATPIGIPSYREDVGQAFASWGNGPGFYLFIPLLGPSSGRDGLGRIFDTALNPATYFFGANFFFNVNAFTSRIEGYETLVQSETDLYFPVRALWAIQREVAVTDYEIPASAYETSDPEPTLGVLLFKVEDPDFPRKAREHRVDIPKTGRRLPYTLWLQEEAAPLVFIIPGIGSHRNSGTPMAAAERAFGRGYSVVTISNPFNWEFITNALSVPYPGYTPSDAEDIYTALSGIYADVKSRHAGRITGAKLMGYSLGAIETLFIAGAQDNRPADALRFDRFVAINPPVMLRYSASRFDSYFDAPLQWPVQERDQKIKELAMKTFLVGQKGVPEGKKVPFDRSESEFLVGFSGRTMLASALDAIERKGNKVLDIRPEMEEGRGLLLSGINQSNFGRYGSELIIPYYLGMREHGLTGDRVAAEASLRAQERLLRSDDKIRIFTNADDFILGDENLAWLRKTAGNRLTVFPEGGHLGNLHKETVQKAIMDALGGTR